MHQAHVFLGPSLDIKTAKQLFPQANYHPPVQCGDLIRLFRLNPDLIVLIDGLYETTPAVWHKEILLALEMGIEVWGAASMGALRAAELHPYGMNGHGSIFMQFKEGTLNDDDEVAVLHLGADEGYMAINDAMVNIRATCEQAWQEQVLPLEAKNELLDYCKTQFYPYRSLKKALDHLSQSQNLPYVRFSQWLESHGIRDAKKMDAIALLTHLNSRTIDAPKKSKSFKQLGSMTCFLRELILFANTSPFKHNAAWLPKIEQKMHILHQQSPMEYMLVAEIVSFMQKLIVFSAAKQQAIDNSALIEYIQKNQLYSPADDFAVYQNHPVLSDIYSLLCQAICLLNLTNEQINEHSEALAHYYALPAAIRARTTKPLRIILVLLFTINQHQKHPNLLIAKKYLTHHLKQLKNWRGYTQPQFKNWLTNPAINRQAFTSLLHLYLMASSVHALSPIKSEYYCWIYDVYAMLFAPTEQSVALAE